MCMESKNILRGKDTSNLNLVPRSPTVRRRGDLTFRHSRDRGTRLVKSLLRVFQKMRRLGRIRERHKLYLKLALRDVEIKMAIKLERNEHIFADVTEVEVRIQVKLEIEKKLGTDIFYFLLYIKDYCSCWDVAFKTV